MTDPNNPPAIPVYSREDVSSFLQQLAIENPALLLNNQAAVFRVLEPNEDGQEPVQIPQRLAVNNPHHTMLFMPARALGITSTKIVAVPKPGEPSGIPGLTLLFDDDTGRVKAMVDASVLTPARTAAGSAFATTLALPPGASKVRSIAIFGGGQQAFWHALILASVYRQTVRNICISPPAGREVSQTLLNTVQSLRQVLESFLTTGFSVRVSTESKDLQDADIVCTATPASAPVFPMEDAKPDAHFNLVGSYKPHMQEVDAKLVQRCAREGTLLLDSIEAVASEAGDLIKANVPATDGVALGALLSPTPPPEGEVWGASEDGIARLHAARDQGAPSMFKSVGIGAQDVAIAHLVCQHATSRQQIYL